MFLLIFDILFCMLSWSSFFFFLNLCCLFWLSFHYCFFFLRDLATLFAINKKTMTALSSGQCRVRCVWNTSVFRYMKLRFSHRQRKIRLFCCICLCLCPRIANRGEWSRRFGYLSNPNSIIGINKCVCKILMYNQLNGKTIASVTQDTSLSNAGNDGLVPPTEINRQESLLTPLLLLLTLLSMSSRKCRKAKRGDLLFKHGREHNIYSTPEDRCFVLLLGRVITRHLSIGYCNIEQQKWPQRLWFLLQSSRSTQWFAVDLQKCASCQTHDSRNHSWSSQSLIMNVILYCFLTYYRWD